MLYTMIETTVLYGPPIPILTPQPNNNNNSINLQVTLNNPTNLARTNNLNKDSISPLDLLLLLKL